MLKKVKRALGIEGVKIELQVAGQSPKTTKVIKGSVILTSLSDNVVEYIDLIFYERYSRGRKSERLVNDYEIGTLRLEGPFSIKAGEKTEKTFALDYVIAESDIDKLAKRPLLSVVAALARRLKKVSSSYRLTAEAQVVGTKLAPFDEATIELIGSTS